MVQPQAGESLLFSLISFLIVLNIGRGSVRWLKQQLRTQLRERRCQLSPLLQSSYAERIARRLSLRAHFIRAKHIALYIAFEGEVSTLPILKMAFLQNKSCYIPVLTKPSLGFVKIHPQSSMIKNRLGILEPTPKEMTTFIAPQALDLVLMPLVAFDKQGHRLGMGGGYYDFTFSFCKWRTKPRLVGLAYDFQRISCVPHGELDLSLNEVITEKRLYLP